MKRNDSPESAPLIMTEEPFDPMSLSRNTVVAQVAPVHRPDLDLGSVIEALDPDPVREAVAVLSVIRDGFHQTAMHEVAQGRPDSAVGTAAGPRQLGH